jgi:hypothetical protein
MTKDSRNDGDNGKEYIVNQQVDTTLSKTEQYFLKMKKKLLGTRGRQDVLVDRRDTLREGDFIGEDRRKNPKDRRDS